jgi:predicted component of type VI protein secretion system
MPAQLLALTDGPSILLDKPILLLGRHGECDIQLNSRKVSRRHCCIAQVNDYLVVRDLGSTNGIRINGHRVLEGKLHSGDELTVGNFRYQVYLDSGGSAEVRALPPPIAAAPPLLDQLENADEPVPLDDATVRADGAILKAKPAPQGVRAAKEDSFVLPDKLRNPPPPER